ncbi:MULTISPECIES: hypothetical protein [Photorhabdus]|uniref:Transcriptional regulator n=1 Tax=Photorhabdus kayaii TaxID=230088 RepID=A0ABX0B8E9_9GAMM|nr:MULTISPECIES: hypothetical protein [Photorhabdus]MCC8374262.1 hypothetical protein [Photorhabdus bodei]MCC8463188.1 hypothetical protein [Photorhabdus bodei]MDB6368903.1 hypothetical protein [Photorhabdus bodei]NDL13382.1 hypothetical protein [Photorhabdus kayaii]NDL27116.1 hypothetical protein [Photorhabdus kayaii]
MPDKFQERKTDSAISEQAVNRTVNKRKPTRSAAINKAIYRVDHFLTKAIL